MPDYVSKPGGGTALEERTKAKERERTEKPRKFRVLLLNDNYTTMEFVVAVLEQVFLRKRRDSVRIMMNVHKNGRGVAGVYVKQVAEAKVDEVHRLAQEHGYPLKCDIEPDSGGPDEGEDT